MVVREGQCRRSDVSEALALLEHTGGTLLGVVFQSKRRRHGYYSGYAGYYGVSANGSVDMDARGA